MLILGGDRFVGQILTGIGNDPGDGGGGLLTANFNSIQDHVFTPICTVCHAGGSAPKGLRLDATNSYTLLVGVPSTEDPSIERVRPGDPDNSYLIQKLEGHASVGGQMPLGGPPLSADAIAVIRQWITDGALRSASAIVTASMQVTAVAPAPGELLPVPPPQIAVTFSGELDATRIDPGAMRIERVLTANDSESVEVLRAAVAIPPGNPRVLLLTPEARPADGHYRVVVRGEPGLEIADIAGHPLQGTVRTPAGDLLIATFDVEARP